MGREYDQDTTVGSSTLRIRTRGRAVLSNPMTNRGTAFDTGVSAVQRPGGADGGISGAGLALGVAGGVGGLWVVWHARRRARC